MYRSSILSIFLLLPVTSCHALDFWMPDQGPKDMKISEIGTYGISIKSEKRFNIARVVYLGHQSTSQCQQASFTLALDDEKGTILNVPLYLHLEKFSFSISPRYLTHSRLDIECLNEKGLRRLYTFSIAELIAEEINRND